VLILVVEENFTSIINEKSYKSKLTAEIKNLAALSKYEIPKEIYFINQFIETETKKIERITTLLKALTI